jgi:Mn2+/Fe2+ NRAMP family transporter
MENLALIDWRMLGFAALWILGLAIVLTVLGFADYRASRESARAADVLRRSGYRAAVNAGLTLFCIGLLGSGHAWWESAIWGSLALAFGFFAWEGWMEYRRSVRSRTAPSSDGSSERE